MFYKKTVKLYLKILILLVTIPLITIYISDPYMLFHEHWFHQGKMYDNMRIQDYGLIRYAKFDGMIMGTSMMENTSAEEASKILKNTYVNLSVSGASPYERFKIIKFALDEKEIKHVIMSLDYHFAEYHKVNNTFYPELYSKNSFNAKRQIYLTTKALNCIFFDKECDFSVTNLDRPQAWFGKTWHNRRFGGFDNWIKYYKEDYQIQEAFAELRAKDIRIDDEYKDYREIIEEEILPLFDYKNTMYSIVIPPYSALWWAKRKNDIEKIMTPYKYLIQKTASLDNVKIYWFYDEDFVFDITTYKDLTHYHQDINSQQLTAIQQNTNIINEQNYQQKFDDFTTKIKKFDLSPYIQRIKEITQ